MRHEKLIGVAVGAMALLLWIPGPVRAQTPGPPTIGATPAPATAATPAAVAPEAQAAFDVTHYDLGLSFNFPQHELDVTAKLTLMPNTTLTSAAFHLNEALQVQSVQDATGLALGHVRQQDRVVVSFNGPQAAGTPIQLTFQYAGTLANSASSPISGIRTAYVGDDGAFLLYPGEWFPMAGYDTDRFTANITATLPDSLTMITSGEATKTPEAGNLVQYAFQQTHASFPGSVIVTALKPQTFSTDGVTNDFYFSPDVPAALVAQYNTAAAQITNFLTNTFGTPPTQHLTYVELPSDALPSFSSPDLIVLSRTSIGSAVNPNLLVDEIAQQWFGVMVSPQTLNDAWLQYGAARFAESLYVEKTEGKGAWQNLVQQLMVGALSYTDTALDQTARLYVFSPEFQDLNYDKGAMLFHMLRWQIGDQAFNDGLRDFVNTYAWKSASTADFEQSLEKSTHSDLRSFFNQWYRGTAIPDFQNQYTVYRLQKGGYRVTGKIQQKLDLFSMPVELSITTDGATATRTIQVTGTSSDFSIDTAQRPRTVEVDPDNWILKTNSTLTLKVDLSRGDNLVTAGNFQGAVQQYEAALKIDPISSLAHYRLAEAYYQEQNWQSAADQYREAMNGDQNPSWVVVWSHIQLGKIFDLTGQRNRAVNEYQLAIATHDDTNGAQATAREYLEKPYSNGQKS